MLRPGTVFSPRMLLALLAGTTAWSCAEGIDPPAESVEVFIPGGAFTMGSEGLCQPEGVADPPACVTSRLDQQSQRCVVLRSFRIDRTEVSNVQYRHCFERGACKEVPYSNSGDFESGYDHETKYDHYPVVNVDWFLAQQYCVWQGKRLPTEAEWEYVAKGRAQRRFPWGNDNPPTSCEQLGVNFGEYWACLRQGGDRRDGAPIPVDFGEEGFLDVSVDGVLQLAGNVHEWVADWYGDRAYCEAATCVSPEDPGCLLDCAGDPYCQKVSAETVVFDPKGPERGTEKVARGGAFDSVNNCLVENSYRFHPTTPATSLLRPENERESLGFRCVRDLLADGQPCGDGTDCSSGRCDGGLCGASEQPQDCAQPTL